MIMMTVTKDEIVETDLLYEQGVLQYFACFHDANNGGLNVELAIFIDRCVGLLHLLTTATSVLRTTARSVRQSP